MHQCDTAGELLDLRGRVRREQNRSALIPHDFITQKAAKFRRRERIKAARRLVEQNNGRTMQQRTGQTKTMNIASRERADLPIQNRFQMQQFGQMRDAPIGITAGKIVERGEQPQILKSRQPRVKAGVGTRMKSQLLQHALRLAFDIGATDPGAASRRNQQCCENSQQRGFAGAIGSHNGHDLAGLHLEGNAAQRGYGSSGEWVQESPPAARSRRKVFLKLFDTKRFVGHLGRYIEESGSGQRLPSDGCRLSYALGAWQGRRVWALKAKGLHLERADRCQQANRAIRNRPVSHNLYSESVVVAAKDQVSCNLEGEIAILSLSKGVYYGLDQIGVRIWGLLQKPRSVGEILDAIVLEYEVEPEHCRNDLLSLLNRLREEGLIEVQSDTVSLTSSKPR